MKCPQTGKVCHDSKEKALHHVKWQQEQLKDDREGIAVFCQYCSQWHVSFKKGQHRSKYK